MNGRTLFLNVDISLDEKKAEVCSFTAFKFCHFNEALGVWTSLCRAGVWEILSFSLRTILQNITFIPPSLPSVGSGIFIPPASSTSSVENAEKNRPTWLFGDHTGLRM